MTALLVAVASAVAGGIGFVLQQHAAEDTAAAGRFNLRHILVLLHRPIWLAGIACMVLSQLLSALALARGDLTLTEPGFATMLLFALPLSATWRRTWLGPREWLGAIALSAGVAGFVIAAQPHGGNPTSPGVGSWVITGAAVIAILAALLLAARRGSAKRLATLRGAAAGLLFGLQDALTRRSLLLLSTGVVALLSSWSGYAVILVGASAVILAQGAFEVAPLAASLPWIAIGEPITGIALGSSLYGEQVALDGWRLAAAVVSLGAIVLGLLLVARSPLVERAASPTGG
jgi:drug/metabolite transporter (DMT)-like permease